MTAAPPTPLVLEAARAVRPYLASLMPGSYAAVDERLATLLKRGAAGEDVRNEVLTLMRGSPACRQWWIEFARGGVPGDVSSAGRRYGELAGSGEPVEMPRFACPHGDYVWYRRAVRQLPPRCPSHPDAALVPDDSV